MGVRAAGFLVACAGLLVASTAAAQSGGALHGAVEPRAAEGPPAVVAPAGAPRVATNQAYLEDLWADLDLDAERAVFAHVFARLPGEVVVYPTENYYYVSFHAAGRWLWGNLRLDVEERDRGFLHFVYWEYLDDPRSPDDGASWHARLGAADGVEVRREGPLAYAVTYGGRTVLFRLNDVPQDPPRRPALGPGERLVMRTLDESGTPFLLVFDAGDLGGDRRADATRDPRRPHLYWVLDEERGYPGVLEPLSPSLDLDRLSGFVYWVPSGGGRRILIGVAAANIRRNNYWDGPFDQLADNFAPPDFASLVEAAYPYTRGRLDRWGKFTDQDGVRMAITPYLEYEDLDEMREWVADCEKEPPDELLACLTYDPKSDVP